MTSCNYEQARLVLIASGKGGVGKSTIAAALGMRLAANGRRVLLLDGDIGLRSLDIMLGLQNKVLFELADCIERRCSLDEATIVHPQLPMLHLMSGGQQSKPKDFSGEGLEKILRTLRQRYDFILVDGPAGIGRGLKNFIALADHILLIATPDEICLRDTERTLQIVREAGGTRPELVLNRYDEKLYYQGELPSARSIALTLDAELLGMIVESGLAYLAMLRGMPLVDADPKVRLAVDGIARRLMGDHSPLKEQKDSTWLRLWHKLWKEDLPG